MTGLIDWAASRARMVMAFIVLSLLAGGVAYVGLPKEGEPDIEIPALFVSVVFPGISAEDSESLLVKPMETQLADLDGLKAITSTGAEGFAGVAMEFEFGWDKTQTMADVRDAMNNAQGEFPEGAQNYSITEINFSEFPIIIVNLTGQVPERTMARVARDLQDRIESLDAVMEAGIAGNRDEMLEVVIDPLRLEAYNVTAGELISVVQNNNQLIAAGEIEGANGSFPIKIPSSFSEAQDVYELPVKTNGERVVTLGDLADIRLTFEDRTGTARFNGETTLALQVVKRRGFNIIDTAAAVRQVVEDAQASWPPELQAAVSVGASNDQSSNVASMVSQLEGSVLTAVALVMIVILATLGPRPAFLVGFAVPTSFLLCFALLAIMGITISNIVMFGLILAVGMLVDGAIVVVEYADKRIAEGEGPMRAYVSSAKRMFWPVVASTATTLCAFLPMLFWPGVAGEFMGMLPVTIIFVLSASLVVALIYLPVLGGVMGRGSRTMQHISDALRARLPWVVRAVLVVPSVALIFVGIAAFAQAERNAGTMLGGGLIMLIGTLLTAITMGAAKFVQHETRIKAGYRRTLFGRVIGLIAGNPVMPVVVIGGVLAFVVTVFAFFGENNNGVEFFVESEPEQAVVYVQARGNLSLEEKDALVREAEAVVLAHPGVASVFAFAGDGGLNTNASGAAVPGDTIGQVQFETIPWDERAGLAALDGDLILAELQAELGQIPGIRTEILAASRGPASAKPVHLRLRGDDFTALKTAADQARERFAATDGLVQIEDTLPLPGIDWEISVDVQKAGRFGADVATVGAAVQLITRGILLDTMRVPSSDEEIEIRVRFPEQDRVLATLDSLKVRTRDGLVPLAAFITRTPVPRLSEINRDSQQRYFDVKAGVADGLFNLRETLETGTRAIGLARSIDSPEEVSGLLVTIRPSAGLGLALNAAFGLGVSYYDLVQPAAGITPATLPDLDGNPAISATALTAATAIEALTGWLETSPLPSGVDWAWTGDQEDQAESQAFLGQAFLGALGLMFIILLAQFNSIYNALIILVAVVLSTTGVLIGMLVMDQTFSIIMTGTGIVALAGIVVNNNIVLIDTYQEFSRYLPKIEAVIRTAEARIRPVLLTTITTMAGLAPMMLGLSLDFVNGGHSIDSPTALMWKNLATAVVFGLGIATVLTLMFTPALLAVRIWFWTYVHWLARALAALSMGRASQSARDWALAREASRTKYTEILWENSETLALPDPALKRYLPLQAAE